MCTYFTLVKSVIALHTETFAMELSLLLYLAYCYIWLPARPYQEPIVRQLVSVSFHLR